MAQSKFIRNLELLWVWLLFGWIIIIYKLVKWMVFKIFNIEE